MNNVVQIRPEKRKSTLDQLTEEIDSDPAFQRAMGKQVTSQNENQSKNGEAVMLGQARLSSWQGLKRHWDAVKTYFSETDKVKHGRLLRRWRGRGECCACDNALASIVEHVVTGNADVAVDRFMRPLDAVLGDDCDARKHYRIAPEQGGASGAELGATAAMCVGLRYRSVMMRSSLDYWGGLMSDHFTIFGDDPLKTIIVAKGLTCDVERIVGNGLAMIASMTVQRVPVIGAGLKKNLEFVEKIPGSVRLYHKTVSGTPGDELIATQYFAVALGFAAMGEYDVWQKVFSQAKSRLEQVAWGKSFVVYDGGIDIDARLNVLWLLNECVNAGRKNVPQQMVEV